MLFISLAPKYSPAMQLTTPISELNRVGKTTAKHLERVGVRTARDLLYYFPFRYEDFRTIVPIKQLQDGIAVTVKAQVELIAAKRSFKRRTNVVEALVSDESGSLRVVWFNQPFIAKVLQAGDTVYFSGVVKTDMLGAKLVSPMYEKVTKAATAHTARLVPIYPLTAGLTERQVRFLIQQVLPLAAVATDWLPAHILQNQHLISLASALKGIHFPDDENELALATERLKFNELFLVQVQAELSRLERSVAVAPQLVFKEQETKAFVGSLPFTLTAAQKIAAWEILKDCAKQIPMNRLLSGDVGSGKTVVAAMALYNAVLNGYQGALMAPTEILAQQHFESLKKLLAGLPITVGLMTANQAVKCRMSNDECRINDQISNAKQRENFNEALQKGEISIVVGTHALLTEGVNFKQLGLVIVDEQHRFGVGQRKIIKEKSGFVSSHEITSDKVSRLHGEVPKGTKPVHFLSMTATPIPRSLALALYGDLDISIINELPPGRKKIITRLVEPHKRDKAYNFIRQEVKKGRQVFVVCPLIEAGGTSDSEFVTRNSELMTANKLQVTSYKSRVTKSDEKKSVMSEYEKLSKKIFPDLRVDYLHGRLKPKEKDSVMQRFKSGEVDVLVSTSVVEVGVDVPNASIMMIEGADRFGLAQLHQFRGRVGRSEYQSYCLLFTDIGAPRVFERLTFFETHYDGFKLAEKDLQLRGPGEVYGTEQSGMMELRLATLSDHMIIKKARAAAQEAAPDIRRYPALAAKLSAWQETVHLE